jgi:type III secretory pathway component EscV
MKQIDRLGSALVLLAAVLMATQILRVHPVPSIVLMAIVLGVSGGIRIVDTEDQSGSLRNGEASRERH